LEAIAHSPYTDSITYKGRVTLSEKRHLMERAHLLLVTSVKEGWGLVVSEANSQGTPAVVYDADGLRDSVKHRKTGLVTDPNPEALAAAAIKLLQDEKLYKRLRVEAFRFSKTLNFDQTYKDIAKYL
jgi:glycosyltransferase involved in cell wall biosynthesis